MSEYIPIALRREIRERASGCCEYCLVHEDDCLLPHEPDHIIASKHRGETIVSNLAWTCFICNRAKGSDIASIEPQTGEVVRLFSPRRDNWSAHFSIDNDGLIIALTDVARVTVSLLRMNRSEQVELRRTLLRYGLYPRNEKADE